MIDFLKSHAEKFLRDCKTTEKGILPYPSFDEMIFEKNPTFVWSAESENRVQKCEFKDDRKTCKNDEKLYTVSVYDDNHKVIFEEKSSSNFYNCKVLLSPGKYSYKVVKNGVVYREESPFQVSSRAIVRERPTKEEVFNAVPNERPRHLFTKSDIESLKEQNADLLEALTENVREAMRIEFVRPLFHRDREATSYRDYIGIIREYLDTGLVSSAIYYALYDDCEVGLFAKKRLLDLVDLNPEGPCSVLGEWGDEIGLSMARCLPTVFDLLYPLLDEKERRYVGKTIATYARQCLERLLKLDFERNPSQSHAGRLPAYLGESALVLKGENIVQDDELLSWLGYALEIYNGIFPFYGCSDGSWAEGIFYATSYTKWYLPFFCAVLKYSGKSLFSRGFYLNFAKFLCEFANPRYEIHPFCDGYWCHPDSEEWPGFFAFNPFNIYSLLADDGCEELENECRKSDRLKLHILDAYIPKEPIKNKILKLKKEMQNQNSVEGDKSACNFYGQFSSRVDGSGFEGVDGSGFGGVDGSGFGGVDGTTEKFSKTIFAQGGFGVLHSNKNSENDICVMARASKFGSGSHRYADNGSFAIFSSGVALITPSGYFGKEYGSKHHFQWTNTSSAHNTILVSGLGQKERSSADVAMMCDCKENEIAMHIFGSSFMDSAKVLLWDRRIALCGRTVTVFDSVETTEEKDITYCLHSFGKPELVGDRVKISHSFGGKIAEVYIVPKSKNLKLQKIIDYFPISISDDEKIASAFAKQYHIFFKSKKGTKHNFEVAFEIPETRSI